MDELVGNIYYAATNCLKDKWGKFDRNGKTTAPNLVGKQKRRMTLILEKLCTIREEFYYLCAQTCSRVPKRKLIKSRAIKIYREKNFNKFKISTLNVRIIAGSEISCKPQMGFIEINAIDKQINAIETKLKNEGLEKRQKYINGFKLGKYTNAPQFSIDNIIKKDQFTLREKCIKSIATEDEIKIWKKIESKQHAKEYRTKFNQINNSIDITDKETTKNINVLENAIVVVKKIKPKTLYEQNVGDGLPNNKRQSPIAINKKADDVKSKIILEETKSIDAKETLNSPSKKIKIKNASKR